MKVWLPNAKCFLLFHVSGCARLCFFTAFSSLKLAANFNSITILFFPVLPFIRTNLLGRILPAVLFLNTSCEYYIYQAIIPHNVSQKFQLSLSVFMYVLAISNNDNFHALSFNKNNLYLHSSMNLIYYRISVQKENTIDYALNDGGV